MTLIKDYHFVINQMNMLYNLGKKFVFVLNYNKTLGICEAIDQLDNRLLKFSINQENSEHIPYTYKFDIESIPFSDYSIKFNRVRDEIMAGNSYLANLTQASKIQTNLSLEEIFHYSKAPYKLWVNDYFVVFSPETFVKIRDGNIATYPMKGTISAEPEENKDILLNDIKENEEHNTIVDLLRNDMSIVATEVRIKSFKNLAKISTHKGAIWQMSSKIEGKLKPQFSNKPGLLFDKLLPAGSVTGAPKVKTVSLLQEIEQYDRGFYSGVFGYFDGVNIDSAVMIRFIEKSETGYLYKSGGGITSNSNPEKEFSELNQKIYVPIF